MKRLCYGIAGLLCAIAPASAQSTAELEQQWQELQQQYAETTRTLEQRIAALEQRIETQRAAESTPKEGTVSVGELAAEAAQKAVSAGWNDVGAKFQGAVRASASPDRCWRGGPRLRTCLGSWTRPQWQRSYGSRLCIC